MMHQAQPATREELQVELDTAKDEYLQPDAARTVDGKFMAMVADHVIGKINGDRVLELGVGDQIWTPKLLARCSHVTSIDGSDELVAAMRARLAGTSAAERWTGIRTFFEDYVPEHRFDVVLATYVLEHVTDPALILRLAQTTWLEPGGVLAVAVPNGFSLHRRLAVKMGLASRPDELGEGDRRIGHKHCFTPDEMGQLLEDCGFEVTEQFGMITKALPNGLLAGCNDAQLKGLFQLGVDLPMEYSGAIGFIAKKKN